MPEKRCYTVKRNSGNFRCEPPDSLCIIKKKEISLDPVGWWKVQNFKKEFDDWLDHQPE